ncbi:hypothetical protein OIU77_009196 [Salix suchowensis]|uniref:Protein TIFY n=1 Tax=Salix suchowensis TaxID=1278906 RepID=A0ABQ9ADI4_9ROSI|nr:hypothetical protein OIU77_009196 [Salix suchowensis]
MNAHEAREKRAPKIHTETAISNSASSLRRIPTTSTAVTNPLIGSWVIPGAEAANESRQSDLKQQEQKQLTIFYNGRVLVCDVAELQARAILLLAGREMEGKLRGPVGSEPSASSPISPSQLYSPAGLPMKRSLQRFLKKRKNRIQATFPYKR